MSEILESALKYALQGWPCLAISPNQKIPVFDKQLQPNGSLSATTDPEKLKQLFELYPDAGLAVTTKNITVVDIDGPEAVESLLKANLTIPTDTLSVRTPRGYHIYLKKTDKLPQTAGILTKVDIRNGEGGYVIVPPTKIVKDGVTTEYKIHNDGPLGEWVELEQYIHNNRNGASPTRQVDPTVLMGDRPGWADELLEEGVKEGQRNNSIARLAGYFKAHNLPINTTLTLLKDFNDKCTPPLDFNDVTTTLNSIYRRVLFDEDFEGMDPIENPLVDISIANRRHYSYPESDLKIEMTRISNKGTGLDCLIEFSSYSDDIYGPIRTNLYSASARNQLVRELKNRRQINWQAYINQVGKLLKTSLDKMGASFDMREYKRKDRDNSWLIQPYLQKGTSTLIFGMGGEGKSTFVYTLLLSLASGKNLIPDIDIGFPSSVMFCDWEDTADSFYDTCTAILAGNDMTWADVPNKVLYRSYSGPLSDYVDQIQKDVTENDIKAIAIDSILASSGIAVEDSESARIWDQCMSELGIASIGITHVSKTESNRTTPYGSVYFWNLSRAVFEVVRENEEDNSSVLAIYHRKGNRTALLPPTGFRVNFENDNKNLAKTITYERADLTETETLVKRLSARERIVALLKPVEGGSKITMTPEEIKVELESIELGAVKRALQRGSKEFGTRGATFKRTTDGQYYLA